MKLKTKDTLSNKPSQLLLQAMLDLEKVEADPNYKIDMGTWFAVNSKCTVCLGGAVMAKTLGLKEAVESFQMTETLVSGEYDANLNFDELIGNLGPDSFMSGSLGRKLSAINCFRTGDVKAALQDMGVAMPEFMRTTNMFGELRAQSDIFDVQPQGTGVGPTLDSLSDSKARREEWREHMATIIGVLEAEGL